MKGRGEVRVSRGGEPESRHRVHAVLAGLEAGEELRWGDPAFPAHWRSSMKPFQALPVVEDGALDAAGLDAPALALLCASHTGTPRHLEGVRRILEAAGLHEGQLACGSHAPFSDEAARAVLRSGGSFTPLHNNCSGKHAGMLALAARRGWPLEGYHRPDHPVQRRIRAELARWLDVDPDGLAWGTDGCGVPTPRLTLRQMARAYARLVRARGAAARVVDAMTGHPELVSGPGRPVTRIMQATGGRLLVKEGAEGVLCLADRQAGWGMALKVVDGGRRATVPAALEALAGAELVSPGEARELAEMRRPAVRNTRGEEVGRVEARMEVARAPVPGGP